MPHRIGFGPHHASDWVISRQFSAKLLQEDMHCESALISSTIKHYSVHDISAGQSPQALLGIALQLGDQFAQVIRWQSFPGKNGRIHDKRSRRRSRSVHRIERAVRDMRGQCTMNWCSRRATCRPRNSTTTPFEFCSRAVFAPPASRDARAHGCAGARNVPCVGDESVAHLRHPQSARMHCDLRRMSC